MKFDIPYLEFVQNKLHFLCGWMPFDCIDHFSEVLVYDINPGGYQRKPEPKHYNKIRDYILKESNIFILPTAVILGLNKEKLNTLVKQKGYLHLDSKDIKEPLFRIVDGQHRIYGLREAKKKDNAIKEFPLPVIIVLTSENQRSKELEIFRDINSKAKRVKVDLIKLASFDYRLKERGINESNLIEHICTKTAFLLKEDKTGSVWTNAIKFDIHNELILGIIGVSSFMESIESLVKFYLRSNPIDTTAKHEAIVKAVNNGSKKIADFLSQCWNKVIKDKWPDAFGSEQVQMDIDEEFKASYYKKDYYIQKTFAVKALNGVIAELLKENGGNEAKTQTALKQKFAASKIKNEDWKIGGTLSGLSSESGVNMLKRMLLGLPAKANPKK